MAKIAVRARAVDMLGRQQIAGIPTAIHELFKNAHDAYATRVEVDYFRTDNLFVLRDDGFGMSRDEFEHRWLTLGTEAKVGANESVAQTPPGMLRRPILGEKGIGRLAIASIGPQVLALTRAGRTRPTSSLTVALINWTLFELPGLDLADIEIPVIDVPDTGSLSVETIHSLIDAIRRNVVDLGDRVSSQDRTRILDELDMAALDFGAIALRLGPPSVLSGEAGTQFYIRPTNKILASDIDSKSEDSASPLEKMLLGFSNSMMPTGDESFRAEFRDHREDGVVEELIGGSTFFTPAEFRSADHHIEGRFDQYGQFLGTVTVYDQQPIQHQIAWPDAGGRETECGPFSIAFGYVQGLPKDSRLPLDEWASISAKLNRIGGLYVYRDGIRILPYGNSDYDFLNIERRRTKSAQDWYFSYRRIMGAVSIGYRENGNLVEKAGREGFRANVAYRQFTAILENFFSRLAIDFFRPTSPFGAEFQAQREALNREAEVLARREKQSRKRRQDFQDKLAAFFIQIEGGQQAAEAKHIVDQLRNRLVSLINSADESRGSALLLECEREAKDRLRRLVEGATITKPRGLGFSKATTADWNAYLKNFAKLTAEVFDPSRQEIASLVASAAQGRGLNQRQRLTETLESRRQIATGEAGRLRREVRQQVISLTSDVDNAIQSSLTQLSSELESTVAEFNRTNTDELNDKQLASLQVEWERRIERSAQSAQSALEQLRDQLVTVTGAVVANESIEETTGALEGQVESYKEQLDSYVELAQVGMALGIVQHEFSNSVRTIKGAIRKLKPWADGTPDLRNLYGDLRNGFEHLEGYLGLFAPMSRRLSRAASDLTGQEIKEYLEEVFGDRLRRHKIVLTATPAFLRKTVHVYHSTFLPVFVNLVDNAIYWITTIPRGTRHILLDGDSKSFVVANTGPGIDRRFADRIFEFGETTKPGGRGMGLYLARQALRRESYDIELMREGSEWPVAFRVYRTEAEGSESDPS